MRLGRFPCGKPLAFRQAFSSSAAMPPEAKPLLLEVSRTESQRLSAREAAKPQKPMDHHPATHEF